MSKIKLTIVILWSLLNTQALKAQDEDKTVTLVVSGQGKTQDEAKQNALRSAIEQAFGAFISSKTEILNDNLVKDEIVSLTNGNIKSFEILSSAELIEIGFVVTLNAQVSLNKIVSFVQNKGFSEVSFNGGGFAMNLKLQRLNEASELNAILNLCEQGLAINKRFIDYELEVGNTELVETSKLDAYTSKGWECDKSKNIKIPLNVKMKKNEKRFIFDQYFIETLTAISMSDNEIESYKSINKKVHIINIMNPKNNMYEHESVLYFRNFKSIDYIKSFVFISNLLPLFNFKIDFDLGQFGISKTINDSMFYYKGNLFDDGSKYQKSYCEFNHWKLNFKKHLSEGIEENPASLFSTVNHLQKN
jgi:hypothetical protein